MEHVVTYFAAGNHDNLLGYDIMNEPGVGSRWVQCENKPGSLNVTKGCRQFDRDSLYPFIKKAIHAIRQSDKKTLIFYEPNIYYGWAAPSFIGKLDDNRLVFNFHNYNTDDLETPLRNMLQAH